MKAMKIALATVVATSALFADIKQEMTEKWEIPKEFLRDNGYRGEVVLNGYWLKKPRIVGRNM
ncbi:MAG: hypothetical protein PF692_10515 [Kiritimatiellae bacterium]|jgi:hypothetical protein|nr:hypothetical protein [Kiritimatiellia bacterium]